jgi:hypothetical protein
MTFGGAILWHWLVEANPGRDRAAELLWIIDDDLRDAAEADLRVFFHIDPETASGPDYFRAAYYTPAYSGAVSLFYRAKADEQAQSNAPRNPGTSRNRPQPATGGTGRTPRTDLPPHLRGRSDVRVVEPTRAGIMNSDLAAVIEMD